MRGYVSGEFAEDTEDGVVSALVIEVVWNGNGGICDGGDDVGFDSTWVMIGRPLETHEQIVAAINGAQ